MRFSNIAPERMLDPAAWYLFFNIKVTAKKENRPSMIYDVFLPFLNDGPIGEAVDRDIETSGWWESIQLAGTCYYRCILCSFRYLLKADGFSQTQQKQLFVQIRASFLQKIKDELTTENGTSDFRSSDVRMINMGCSQTLYAAMKLAKREGINSKGMLRLEALVNDVQALVDATPKLDSDKTELQVQFIINFFFFFSYSSAPVFDDPDKNKTSHKNVSTNILLRRSLPTLPPLSCPLPSVFSSLMLSLTHTVSLFSLSLLSFSPQCCCQCADSKS